MEEVAFIVEGIIVTGDADGHVFGEGAIAIQGERILAVGPRSELTARYSGERTLGGPNCVVHPGLIDCHQHASQTLVRSLIAHELPMIYRLYIPAEQAMTEADVQLSATLLQAQLLRSGVTTFAETTATREHEEMIAESIEAVGMRCAIGRGVGDQDFQHASFYSQRTDRSLARARAGHALRDLERTERLLERYDPSGAGRIKGTVVAPHITNTSPEYFRQATALAAQHDTSLQVHVSRDREEVEFCLAIYGRWPIEQLCEFGALTDRLLAIHAILIRDREISLLAEAGAAVAHQPVECLNILNGLPPIRQLLDAGIAVGLGSDNVLNDGYEIMRAAWMLHTAVSGMPSYDPEYLPAERVFEMATLLGARALRWEHAIGSLERNKQADLVVVDLDSPYLTPLQHPIVDLVRYGSRAEVQHVMVSGTLLVENRHLQTIDEERLYADARAAGPAMAAAVTPRRYRPLAPGIEWIES